VKKIKKIALISLIWLLTIYFISVVQSPTIYVSSTSSSFSQIPMIFWIVALISPFLLYIIAKDSENPLVSVLCVVLYFFIFYSSGLYFMTRPISDIQDSTRFQEILSSITHVGSREIDYERYITTARYFQWPVYFIFSKIFNSVLGIGAILTLNLGFFSLLLVLPFVLPLFYGGTSNVKKFSVYFILPALYLTLGWHFINSQFVPQFLGLVYLFILFGCYLKYMNGKNPLYLLLIVIFYAMTVFTHPFMHMFFLVAMIFEFYWPEYVEMKRAKFVTYGMVIIFFAIMFPYFDVYYSMAATTSGGASWKIFESFLSQGGTGGTGHQVHILYHLVPMIYDQVTSSVTKVLMVAAFSIIIGGFILYILKRRKLFDFKKRVLFDISILIGSASWFVLGLANLVLGQRALQVASLPLAKYFKSRNRIFSLVSKILIVVIILAPASFMATDMINLSIEGSRLIQDYEENIAGRFIDKHVTNVSIVMTAQNAYPTGYPSGFIEFTGSWENLNEVDVILDSPKLRNNLMYFNMSLPRSQYDIVVYDNKDIELIVNE